MNQVIKFSVEDDGMSIHRSVMAVPQSLPDVILVNQDVLYIEIVDTSTESYAARFGRLLLHHRLWAVIDVTVRGGALAVGRVVLPAEL